MRRDRQAEADYQKPFVSGKEHELILKAAG